MSNRTLTARLVIPLSTLMVCACGEGDGDAAAPAGGAVDVGEQFWDVGGAADVGVDGADAASAADSVDSASDVTSTVDPACYQACMKAGKGEAVCTKGCPIKAGGGKAGGGKGDAACYDGCIAKNRGKQTYCKEGCACYDGCSAKGKSAADCLGCFAGGKGGDAGAEACYNECVKTDTPTVCKGKCYSK